MGKNSFNDNYVQSVALIFLVDFYIAILKGLKMNHYTALVVYAYYAYMTIIVLGLLLLTIKVCLICKRWMLYMLIV